MKDVSIHKCILHIKNRPNCLVCFRYIMLHCNFVTIETMTRSKNEKRARSVYMGYLSHRLYKLTDQCTVKYNNTVISKHTRTCSLTRSDEKSSFVKQQSFKFTPTSLYIYRKMHNLLYHLRLLYKHPW